MTTTTSLRIHKSVEERAAEGKAARKRVSRSSHLGWSPAPNRPDPVATLAEQDVARDDDLVPVRHGRMLVSPFTFYRGAARIMAVDLRDTPRAGLEVQLCGDAHLSNFGVFASPERTLVFDLNDFDETLPGPFEYDVERLIASVVVAARNNGFVARDTRRVALSAVQEYRERMAEYAGMGTLAIWYSHLAAEDTLAVFRTAVAKKRKKVQGQTDAVLQKARTKDSLQALSKLGEIVDGEYRIVSNPPLVVPAREIGAVYGIDREAVEKFVSESLDEYRSTLEEDRRRLLDRYRIVDVARKVVGVGSVGTRAFIALLQGRDEEDPLFLQVKEATSSVLEDHLPPSTYANHGERVVQGQRMIQATSDIFLGWTLGLDVRRCFYWRQLRDMKGSADVEAMAPDILSIYARVCGWALARAHARSGDAIAISSYLGGGDQFDQAMVDFGERYADQNERDYEAFAAAVRSGRLAAVEGL